jgi:hypothetical protein
LGWSLAFDPLLPIWAVAALAALAVALSLAALARRVRGAAVRLAAGLCLALALLNPSLIEEKRARLTSVAAVVVDRSQSQAIGDRTAQTDAALAGLAERLGTLEGVETRIIEARPGNGEAGDGTRLFEALANGLADVPPDRVAGAVLLTDGQVHDIPEAAARLGFQAPVHALVTGSEDEIDRRIVMEQAPRFGLVGTEQSVRLRVVDDGPTPAGGQVRLTVRRDGEEIDQTVAPVGTPFDVPFTLDHGGQNIFEFEVEPLAGELTEVNNTAVAVVEGVRENLRVLLVSGEPHAGERTWRNLLKSDASVDLVHFTILRPPEKQDGTPINQLSLIAFPTRELFSVKIAEFDLIIFDRYQRRGILPLVYFDNIARYVRDGGAVLVASGPDYSAGDSLFDTPLGAVLPAEPTGAVVDQPYHARLSDLGRRHPVTRDLPGAQSDPPDWGRWFQLVEAAPSSGQTVMSGPGDRPLLVLGREGEGRAAVMLSDQAWLWARGYEGGGPHVPLLRRLAHWLMQEPELEEEALRLSVRGDRLTVERQTLGEEVGPVTLTNPDGSTRTLTLEEAEPGLWRATADAAGVGLYVAVEGDRRALAHVGPTNPKEFLDVRSTAEPLAALAEDTGGSVRRIVEDGAVALPRVTTLRRAGRYAGEDWIGLKTSDATVLEGLVRLPLFAGFLGLAILLGMVSATWVREGR